MLSTGQSDTDELWSIIASSRDSLTELLSRAIEDRIPFYAERKDEHQSGELRRSVGAAVDTFITLHKSDRPEWWSSALLQVNHERSLQGVPLDAIHRTWHLATREVWLWLMSVKEENESKFNEAALVVWDEWLAFVDHYIPLVTDLYLQAQRAASQSETIAMNMALDHLLDNGTEIETKNTLRWLFFRSNRMVLGLFEFDHDHADPEPSQIREFASVLANAGSETNVRSLWTLHDGRIVVVFDADPRNISNVRNAITRLPVGVSGGLSHISDPHVRLSTLHRQAAIALRSAPPGGLIELGSLSLFKLVAADVSLSWTDLPQRIRDFYREDAHYAGEWVATAQALWNASMNARAAAERLHVHPNTIYYRLATIHSKCGVDLRDAEELLGIKLVYEAVALGTLTLLDSE